MGSLQKIDHIVVLMLENRSFDSLLGTVYPKPDSFEGLTGTEQNPDANGTPVVVWNSPGTDETTMRIPNPDPGELWTDINMQLFGNSAPAPGQTPRCGRSFAMTPCAVTPIEITPVPNCASPMT